MNVTHGSRAGSGIRSAFTTGEWTRLAGFYAVVGSLHAIGCLLYLRDAPGHPALVGLGLAAYLLGLRHAFDADHIAAVDDTVRYLLRERRAPLGVGFFFSLGHSTVVLLLTVGVATAASAVQAGLPALQDIGWLIGASVSGLFLWIVGLLNLRLLFDLLQLWKRPDARGHDHAILDRAMAPRGLLDRLAGGRLRRLLRASWQMYPLGLLFGLGLDTASEVGLLLMTAGAATGNLPIGGVLSLPILFAAGMTLIDTTDGILMAKAYDWALVNPLRRIIYNVVTTGLSVAVALVVGTIELLQVLARLFDLPGGVDDLLHRIDIGMLGYVVVAVLMAAWAVAALSWRFGRREPRAGVGRHEPTNARTAGPCETVDVRRAAGGRFPPAH